MKLLDLLTEQTDATVYYYENAYGSRDSNTVKIKFKLSELISLIGMSKGKIETAVSKLGAANKTHLYLMDDVLASKKSKAEMGQLKSKKTLGFSPMNGALGSCGFSLVSFKEAEKVAEKATKNGFSN